MKTAELPKPKLKDDALYFGDNGRCFCGAHAGMTARYTGRDLSGQRVERITPRVVAEYESFALEQGDKVEAIRPLRCETPGCTVKPPSRTP